MKKALSILCALMLIFCFAGCEAGAEVNGNAGDGGADAEMQIEARENKNAQNATKESSDTDTGAEKKGMSGEKMIEDHLNMDVEDGVVNGVNNGTAGDSVNTTGKKTDK